MRVIIPLAGFGKRMRPHTWSKPKPLLNVAGKPVLGHILDKLVPLNIDRAVFVVGWLGEQIEEYVSAHYDFPAYYVVQQELRGQAHALYLAREHLAGPCVIVFVDTLSDADLSGLEKRPVDGVLFVKEVDDPRRFGVVVEEGDRIVKLIEKPDTLENRKAVIGIYYVRDGAALVDAIEYILEHKIQTKGEYYIANALQVMMDRGAHLVSETVSMWEDCGEPETMLHTNRYLLEHGYSCGSEGRNSVVIPPVYIAPTAKIEDSVVGPHVTIGDHVHLQGSIVRDTIIEEGCTIEGTAFEHSLIGRNVTIRGTLKKLNIGDNDVVDLA